jgi:hypothetical protein
MNIEEEIGEEEPLKSTPEDEVFDQGEMGVGVMSGIEEESGKDLDGERWIISERKGSKRCKTIPVQADRRSSRTLESELSMTEKAAQLVASKNLEESDLADSVGRQAPECLRLGDQTGQDAVEAVGAT